MTTSQTALRRSPHAPADTLPRVLPPDMGVRTLGAHVEHYGPLPRADARLLAELDASGLRGRGGAAFPVGRKWRTVATGRGTKVVVANGAEGEPASFKDRMLLSLQPHLVLDGLAIAAETVGATSAIIAVDRVRTDAVRTVRRALDERAAAQIDAVPIRLVEVPNRYLAGEESALVHFINGGEAKPTAVPPRPYERGVGQRPTLIQNVETLAHVSLIAREGAEWFRAIGTESEPGSMLATVGGAVSRPGVCELSIGTPIERLLEATGGVTDEVQAILFGGYFGSWLDVSTAMRLDLSNASLTANRAALGCGVVYVLGRRSCGLVESANVLRYLAHETAGQCGPCVNGVGAAARTLHEVARHGANQRQLDDLSRWIDVVPGRGACRMPDGAMRFLQSSLKVFHDELVLHAKGRCSATNRASVLPVSTSEVGWR